MAGLAICGKSAQHMIGIRRALEILHVAGGAGGICDGQIVVVVYVARSARHAYVRSSERKPCCTVIKVGLKPGIHPMARLAIYGKAGPHVIRRHSALKIPHVAGIAISR